MDFTDLETFRSKYSDLTVTAVPAKRRNLDAQPENWDTAKQVEKSPTALVEINPIKASSAAASTFQQRSKRMKKQQQPQLQLQQQQQQAEDVVAYSNEYQQVLAKLEYTKYVQAQLQMMSASNGIVGNSYESNGIVGNSYDSNGIVGNSYDSNGTSNIVDVYDNLLSVIAEMQSCLGPTAMGLRAPKERLLCDIAHARILVRECVLMLMHNQ